MEQKKYNTMKFYIKERRNPQLKKSYYVAEGKLSKKDASKKEDSVYGENYMLSYDTEKEYLDAIDTLKKTGVNVIFSAIYY